MRLTPERQKLMLEFIKGCIDGDAEEADDDSVDCRSDGEPECTGKVDNDEVNEVSGPLMVDDGFSRVGARVLVLDGPPESTGDSRTRGKRYRADVALVAAAMALRTPQPVLSGDGFMVLFKP